MMEYDALYVQLMNSIMEKMQRGEYQVGDRLDSERVMSQQYGISRLTIRKALKKLEEQGYVMARRGSGTFVIKVPMSSRRIDQGVQASMSLGVVIRQSGYESCRKVISVEKVPVGGVLAEKFSGSSQMFELVRLSYVNGEPYAVQKAYIPAEIFWDVARYDLSEGSLYEYMDTHGHMPKRVESYMQIVEIPEEYVGLMNLQSGKKVFLVVYLGYDSEGELMEYTYSYYLPQYTSFKYVIEKNTRVNA